MMWTDVVTEVELLAVGGRGDVEVQGVQYDSRRVMAGDVFVAMRGGNTDGNHYVDAAIRKGAVAVVTDSDDVFARLWELQPALALGFIGPGTAGRRALAAISAVVFGHPERMLKISAVTGTNGKTTTAFLLEQMLESVRRKCVLLGTIETHVAGAIRVSEHTTPESRDILAVFAEGIRAGCTEAVMEMSSHALEQERVWGMPVDVAMFTNLTQDHLDYHGTMEAYAAAKARLFEGVGGGAPRVAAINMDDPWGVALMARLSKNTRGMPYGIESPSAGYRATGIALRAGETSFDWVTPEASVRVKTPLTGRVNVSNWLAASCAALARGLTMDEVVAASERLRQVPGRFEVVAGSGLIAEGGVGFTVVVDYAHTDDALANLIALARDLVGEHGGRVITMFGCGGDRDRTKRPKMGRVAGVGSDLVVVTSDNPRSEAPAAILDEVMVGVRATGVACVVEEDRRAAIEVAIRAAKAGDIVLLAGKGHEKTQTFADGMVAFDDVAEAERVLREMMEQE